MNSSKPTRKTLIAVLAATSLAAGSTLAQPYGQGYGQGTQSWPCPRGLGMGPGAGSASGDWVQNRLDRMALRLNLTQEQQARLEPILRQREAMRTAQRQAMREEVAAILTPEQRAQYELMGPGRGGRMGRGMGYGSQGPAW